MTHRISRRTATALGLSAVAGMGLAACVPGEGSENAAAGSGGEGGAGEWSTDSLTIDWATYNPLSLVIRDQQLIENALGDSVTVEWVQSAGSNKANEFLRSGSADIASTAGSAALLARANGSPIKVIGIYSQPEWAALVVGEGSDISSPADLAGRAIAATRAARMRSHGGPGSSTAGTSPLTNVARPSATAATFRCVAAAVILPERSSPT